VKDAIYSFDQVKEKLQNMLTFMYCTVIEVTVCRDFSSFFNVSQPTAEPDSFFLN
jgi:hypothetical protein